MLFQAFNNRPNYPVSPKRDRKDFSFPNDLVADGRNFYTQIEFYKYSGFNLPSWSELFNSTPLSFFSNLTAQTTKGTPTGSLRLPLPKKINDTMTLSWNEYSATDTGLGIASRALQVFGGRTGAIAGTVGGAAFGYGGIAAGLALNPLLFQQFQRPNFREFTLQWVLAPRTEQESNTIKSIITKFKKAAAPTNQGPILGYPNLALIKFAPNDIFGSMIINPCAIISIQADYAPAGPSFFDKTGAPTLVGLTVHLKEISLLYSEDIT